MSREVHGARPVVRALALTALVACAGVVAALPGCGGSSSTSAPGNFAVVYLRGGPTFTALDTSASHNPAFAANEVWIAPVAVRLVASNGQRAALALNDTTNQIDLCGATPTASLFAYGAFSAGEYSGIEVVVGKSVMHGTPTAAPGTEADKVLLLASAYSAPFATPLTITALSSSYVIDWAPSVSANAAATQFTLNDTAVLHTIGGAQAGDPATLDARDLLGAMVAQNCVTGNLQFETPQGFLFPATATGATVFLDHEFTTGTSSVCLCTSVNLDDIDLVNGTVQPSGAQFANTVRVLREGALPQQFLRTQFKGVIRSVAPNGNVGVDMLLSQGDVQVARVFTDGSTPLGGGKGTVIETEAGATTTFTALVKGTHVRIVSSAVQAGNPPVSVTTDLVIIEEP